MDASGSATQNKNEYKETHNMKSIKIAGLCLVAMFTMSMALAGNASAAPLWLLCLPWAGGNVTRYETNQCTKVLGTGQWESVAIGSKTDTVSLKAFTLRLRDKAATGGASEIECNSDLVKDPSGGTISSNNEGKILTAEINITEVNKRCTRLSGGCEAGKIEE